MDLQKYCDKRTMSGYGSALLYKDASAGDTLYHLLLPLESVPAVAGSVDTFDFDILTCPSKGQVEGKESLDQVDVDFMWHRDNVRRLESLQGKVLDFLAVYRDFTARAFSGTIKVRPQNSEADIQRGIFSITPLSSATTSILDARDLIQDTVVFANKIAESVVVGSTAKVIEIATDPAKTATSITATSNNNAFTVTVTAATETTNASISIAKSGTATDKQYGVVTITATATDYASWETTIAVESE